MKKEKKDIDSLIVKFPKLYRILNEYYGLDSIAKYSIEELILDRIGNSENYKVYWKDGVLKNIGSEIGCNVQGITFGFIPNYGGQVQFSNEIDSNRKDITQIQFYVSLLDNVYTIQILEIEESKEFNPMMKLTLPKQTLKEIWVSPENHRHKDLFLKIQSSLEAITENPIFLPYSIQEIELKGVKPPIMEDKVIYTVGDAFFRKILPLHRNEALIKGNPDYEINKLT